MRSSLIIIHDLIQGIRHLLPKTVPFPYLRLSDYETAMRQPVGRDWNAQTSHKKLVKPKFSTMVSVSGLLYFSASITVHAHCQCNIIVLSMICIKYEKAMYMSISVCLELGIGAS